MKLRSPCHTLPPYGAQQCGREVTPAEISQGKTLPANVAKVSGRGGASDVIRNLLRWRQRVSDERSNTNPCWKNASPQKYWKYGFSTQRSHKASSERS